jgi:hypothetical protein
MTATHAFRFSPFQVTTGTDLKFRLTISGETFDCESVDEDLGTDGTPLWRINIRFGDRQRGILFFERDDEPRSQSIEALRDALASAPGLPVPAVLESRVTCSGRTFFWLADPQS